eukprot:405290_1
MSSFLWMNLLSLIHAFQINDFQIGIQFCDENAGQDVGETQQSPWLRNGGGWSAWASDNFWGDPDGMRIGIWGRHNYATGDTEFALEDTDIRFCIQLSDDVSHEMGNSRYNGRTQCTPWASSGGGWSDWAGDKNWKDFNAAKVRIQTQAQPGLLIGDIRAGIRLTSTDDGTQYSSMGYTELTEWLIGAQTTTHSWSGWAGDFDFSKPDGARIFIGVQMSLGNNDWDSASDQDERDWIITPENEVGPKNESHSMGIFEIVIICLVGLIMIGCIIVGGYLYRFWKNKNNDHKPVYLDDSDDNGDEDEELDIVADVELEGIKECEHKSTIST